MTGTAIDADTFAALMAACGPFEDAPHLAVAVSGGADSMALALLAHDWGTARGGRVTGLTVDHGLRAGSAAEARQTGRWLADRGIRHEILSWQGDKPERGIQAAARDARYRLLADWCRKHDVLHLLLAHHADDQAETVALRQARGSGPTGLAGMARVAPPPVPGPRTPRLVRPLLDVPRTALAATLRARGQAWVDDPSNRDPAYARVIVRERLRQSPELAAVLHETAEASRRGLAARDDDEARRFAPYVVVHGAGYMEIEAGWARSLDPDAASALWRRAVMTVTGQAYPPRSERLVRLVGAIGASDFRGATLSGARIGLRGGAFLILREAAAARSIIPFRPGEVWDRRFLLTGAAPCELMVRRLGEAGWRALRRRAGAARIATLPGAVRQTLPALWRESECIGLPGIAGLECAQVAVPGVFARFLPVRAFVW